MQAQFSEARNWAWEIAKNRFASAGFDLDGAHPVSFHSAISASIY